MKNAKFYLPKTLDEKFEMLQGWIEEFTLINENHSLKVDGDHLIFKNIQPNEEVVFTKSETKENDMSKSIFYVSDKIFNKNKFKT